MRYQLWLLRDKTGTVTLNGWTETTQTTTPSTATPKIEHWPTYTLCQHRDQLPNRLAELGLKPDAGFDINDLDKDWDVYLTHPNPTSLRATLDAPQTDQPSRLTSHRQQAAPNRPKASG